MNYSEFFMELMPTLQFAGINGIRYDGKNVLHTSSTIDRFPIEVNISRKNTGFLVAEYCFKFKHIDEEIEIRKWFDNQNVVFRNEFNYVYEPDDLRVYLCAIDRIEYDREANYSASELRIYVSWAFQKLIFMHRLVGLV